MTRVAYLKVDDDRTDVLVDGIAYAAIFDNASGAPGFGPARNAGRWAVEVAGRWVANVDRRADAKRLAADAALAAAPTGR